MQFEEFQAQIKINKDAMIDAEVAQIKEVIESHYQPFGAIQYNIKTYSDAIIDKLEKEYPFLYFYLNHIKNMIEWKISSNYKLLYDL